MLVVTGATGQFGGRVLDRLLERVPAERVAVSVRDPRKAGALAERGVGVRRGDYDDPDSLRHAFEGATQVLVVSGSTVGGDAVRQHRAAIEAAVASGAGRILYTSHQASNPASAFAPAADHAATETILADSGVAFTSLRNGFYASSGLMLLGPWRETGTITAPEDGPVSWTARADLADAAAAALSEEGRLDGLTPPLTAAAAVTLDEVAAIASEVAGRTITRVTVSDEEWTANMVQHGVPAHAAEMLLGAFIASRHGEFDAVDPTLGQLLGRTPQSMGEVLGAPAAI